MSIDIQGFIQDGRAGGMSDDAIKSALLNMGVDQLEVNAALPIVVAKEIPAQLNIPQQAQPRATAPQTVGTSGAQPTAPSGGMSATNPVFGNQPAVVSPQATGIAAPKSKKPLAIIIATIVILGLAGAGYLFFIKNKAVTGNSTSETATTSVAAITPAEDPDLAAAKASFDAMIFAANTGDIATFKQYIVKTDASIAEQGSFSKATTTFLGATKEGASVIISAIQTPGSESPLDLIFVMEDGVWKWDVSASFKRLTAQFDQKIAAPPSGTGDVDLTMTSISVTPASPTVGDKNLKIFGVLKNIGTKELVAFNDPASGKKVLSFTIKITAGGKTESVPGTFIGNILPGGSTNLDVQNIFLDISTPGPRTITFIINGDKAIQESNYSNNTFGKSFTAVAGGGSAAASPPAPAPKTAIVFPTSYNMNVLVLKYFPLTSDGQNIDVNVTGDVSDSYSLIRQRTIDVINDLLVDLPRATQYRGYANSSASASLHYSIVDTKEYTKAVPLDLSTRRPLYNQLLTDNNICDYVKNRGVNEVWVWAYQGPSTVDGKPYLNISESKMSGPFGDISNSYRLNDMPNCGKTYRVYTFNYGRGTYEAMESWGHQMESEIDAVSRTLFRDIFQGPNYPQTSGVTGRCGSVHNPPNARSEYDRNNPTSQKSDCLDWTPYGTGALTSISCQNWGCADISDNNNPNLNYMIWNWQNLPGLNNTKKYQNKILRNFWDIHGDFDNVMANDKTIFFGI